MSLGTIIGVIVGLALFLVNVFFGSAPASAFWDFNSVLTVFGGTIAATFIAYNERYVISAFKAIGSIFVKTKVDQKILFADVEKIIGWGEIMNKGGLQELQKNFDEKEYENHVIKFGMEMVFMGEKTNIVYSETENLIETMHDRKMQTVEVLENMASFAPAFGMIGTLIGLVILLSDLSNKDALGAGMAVALITTLYGVLFANLLLKPAARKLAQKHEMYQYRDRLILEGIAMLPEKKHPMLIQNHLNSYLDPANHFDVAG